MESAGETVEFTFLTSAGYGLRYIIVIPGLEITAGHHCGGEAEKSLLHSDERLLFQTLAYSAF